MGSWVLVCNGISGADATKKASVEVSYRGAATKPTIEPIVTRRNLFAALLAPLVAKFARKPLPESGVAIARAAERVRVVEFWPRDNPFLYFMPPVKMYPWQEHYDADMEFLSGKQWDVRTASLAQGRPCLAFNRLEPFVKHVIDQIRDRA